MCTLKYSVVVNTMNTFKKYDVTVSEEFIKKFAQKYVEQRNRLNYDIDNENIFNDVEFSTDTLKSILKKNSVAKDYKREQNIKPTILNDIYRSDLGELLMTYYFEEKIDNESRFIIPLKNISYRELAEQPGRGLDAIGYNNNNDKINLLLGEAKVSGQKRNPPAVVDSSSDSIYHTQKKYNDDYKEVLRKLSDYCRRLHAEEAKILGAVIVQMDAEKHDLYNLTFGCTLIRDYTCVDESKDFGKMKTNQKVFAPNTIHFSILSFTKNDIETTVELFYNKVQELISEK